MNISKRIWKNYIDGLSKVSDTAKQLILKYLEMHSIDTFEEREAFIEYCYGVSTKYGEAAAEFACQMYDAESEYEGVLVDPAEPAEPATMEEVAKAVNGTLKYILAAEVTASAVGRLVKMAGQDTTLKNAIRDKAYYAWIPMGDTCPFCLSIAAEGWQRATAQALAGGHAEHIHGNCDCSYATKHETETSYKAYDPSQYSKIYDNAEGDTEEEKINYMRRQAYKTNKDRINEQKRIAYEKRKELESSTESVN
jgi:hypothetical protein